MMPNPPEKPEKTPASGPRKFKAGSWLSMGQMATSGLELGLTVAALTLLGWWLDTQWNSSPWMMITGTLVGTTGSIYKMWRMNEKWQGRK